MGVFNKINEKSGVIVTVIVVALILFILGGDLLGPNSFFKSNSQDVGEINGKDISLEEYSREVETRKMNYMNQTGKNPSENEMPEIYNQAWTELVYKYAYAPQYENLGLTVTEEEVEEMVSGKNLHEGITEAPIFKNEITQQFDRNLYNEWRKNLSGNQQAMMIFENFKNSLPESRLRTKYFNLFQKSVYVTKEEARREYQAQNTKAEVKYLYVPYYSVSDTAFKVTDDQIEDYIEKNKGLYKVEEGRSIEYVLFKVAPSREDSAQAKKELQELAQEFAEADNDSLFVSSNSDSPVLPSVMNLGELPEQLKKKTDDFTKGKVYGPYDEAGKYKLYKVIDVITDSKDSNYFASTKHILFMTRDKTPQQKDSIKKKATEVLEQLKKGADFDEMVLKYSEDPGSKNTGGEYKWFAKNQMVKAFDEAVFTAKSEGLVPKLVETEYGFHILKVTNTKSNKKFKIAVIEKDLLSSEGREKAYQQANNFANLVKDTASFRAQTKKDSLMIQKFKNMKKNEQYVNSLVNPRELIRWAYNEADQGDVSPVLPSGDQYYVVAVITDVREKGTARVEDVRDEVKPKVLAEMKAEQIIEKLKNISGDLDKKAAAYGPTASTGVATDVSIASGSIQGIGYDPTIVGTVFGLAPGKRTVPLKGDNGVVILELIKISEAPEIADYTSYKTSAKQQRSASITNDIDKAIREAAEIEDERVKFF
jgi:peptidyl-prolyl cis-trans isomerase D